MTNISYNLSGKIDPLLVKILRLIHQETSFCIGFISYPMAR